MRPTRQAAMEHKMEAWIRDLAVGDWFRKSSLLRCAGIEWNSPRRVRDRAERAAEIVLARFVRAGLAQSAAPSFRNSYVRTEST